jgi:hypothetical protein
LLAARNLGLHLWARIQKIREKASMASEQATGADAGGKTGARWCVCVPSGCAKTVKDDLRCVGLEVAEREFNHGGCSCMLQTLRVFIYASHSLSLFHPRWCIVMCTTTLYHSAIFLIDLTPISHRAAHANGWTGVSRCS